MASKVARLETRKEPVDLLELAQAVGKHAAARDVEGSFPQEAFDVLRREGLLAGPPITGARMDLLLPLLAAVGRGDLNVGRIYEGHVNALQLIERFGTPDQFAFYESEAAAGRLLGVWNTDAPGNPLRLERRTLRGAKTFASGVDGVARAIVTVEGDGGRRMIVVPVAGRPVDRTWWRPLGMRASGSHVIELDGVTVDDDWLIGRPGDYTAQPWFSAGAIRFVAVHVGGMHAVADAARDHLIRLRRADDPYQAQRLGEMAIRVEGGYAWLARAAEAWEAGCEGRGNEDGKAHALAHANAARVAVEGLAMDVLTLAQKAVGCGGLIAPHPLERLIRDLTTYLRQPNPDGALAHAGSAFASGELRIGETFVPRR